MDFFVIGAQKAGTTSVYKYLSKHPDIYLPPEKEAPFFSDDDAFSRGFSAYCDEYFGSATAGAILGTVTPQYMMVPSVPGRIKETCPDAKLIAILRDPIERAYSHYKMATRTKRETRTFEEAISQQLNTSYLQAARHKPLFPQEFVIFGEYGRILEKYFSQFRREQILVLSMKELTETPFVFMKTLFEFLCVDNKNLSNIGKKYHSSNISPLMSYLAHLSFDTRLKLLGKLLPEKMRRTFRFWLGLNRENQSKGFDSSFKLSPSLHAELKRLYRKDAAIITRLTIEEPYWIQLWDKK